MKADGSMTGQSASDYSKIGQFVEIWVAELAKSVEMFSGEAQTLRHARANAESLAESEGAVWIKQTFTEEARFDVWIGAPEATWQSVGGALGEGTPEALRSTYCEIVNQAQQGAANAINAAFGRAVELEKAAVYLAPGFAADDFLMFDIELVGAAPRSLILAIELRAREIFDRFAKDPNGDSAARSEANARSIQSSVLTLELPVSVSVGRSELEMKRALTAGPGTVIGLNQESSELVALLVHGRVVARGEMVLVKGHYGFRVKEILNRRDRLVMCSS